MSSLDSRLRVSCRALSSQNAIAIVAQIGRGGMGEVYRADDLRLGQTVALKFLPESLTHDAAALARLNREVRMARQVSHPNVCRVLDVGEADGVPFISMEFVDGEDLASLLQRIGRLPQDKAVQVAHQLCAGLAEAQDSSAARPQVRVGFDDTAMLLFSGGTTGTPNAAIIRHQALVIAGMQFCAWGCNVLRTWESVGVLTMPLFHIYGTWLLAAAIQGHYTFALVPNPRDLNDVLATVRRTHAVYLPAVPTLPTALLEHPRVRGGKRDLQSVQICGCAAAPLMQETRRRWRDATGVSVTEGYALTESCAGATVNPVHGQQKPASVGIPLPDIEVRIVDADTGHETLPPGNVGEILMRAPQMIRGYWGSAAESESMLRDGWLYTGDLGYMDEEGYLFLVDRKKDVIKASGFQVWPREVEEAIASHPAVSQVGVAGVPDAQRGEAVKAWVVLKQGQHVTTDEICAHCRQHLAPYKVPRHVEFRTSLPTTLVGKVLRRELRSEARAAAGGH